MLYRTDVKHLSHFLQEVDLFQGLAERHLDRIAALCEETSFKAGELLAIQRDQGSRLYVLRRGQVLATTGFGDASLKVRTLGEHETFPVAVLLEPPVLVTTARAVTDGEALVIPRVRLLELCELEPRIGMHIYRAVSAIVMNRYRWALDQLSQSMKPAVQLGAPWEKRGGEV